MRVKAAVNNHQNDNMWITGCYMRKTRHFREQGGEQQWILEVSKKQEMRDKRNRRDRSHK